jgi:adenylate kinase
MSKLSLAKAAITGGIRLIKGGAKSYGKIKKAKSISKGGVESALSRAGVPRSLGKIKAKANAFKGVASAGATKVAKVAKTASKRMPKVNPYGAAAAVGAAGGIALQSKIQKAKKSPAAPKMSAPKKAAPKKAAPKKAATVKIAPYQAKSVVAKAKPRAASFTPTAKKTPTSVSAGKKKVGYVKSKRSLRRR